VSTFEGRKWARQCSAAGRLLGAGQARVPYYNSWIVVFTAGPVGLDKLILLHILTYPTQGDSATMIYQGMSRCSSLYFLSYRLSDNVNYIPHQYLDHD
jgi:hypothetical protein